MNLSQIEYPDEAEDCRLCYRRRGGAPRHGCEAAGYEQIQDRQRRARPVSQSGARPAPGWQPLSEGQRDLSQEVRHLHRDLDIVAETLALWLRYFLTVTPPLPAGDQEPARLIGRQRFDVFIREIARRKPSDKRYLTRVVKLAAKEGSGPRPGAVSPRPPPEGKPDQATDGATGGKDDDTKNGG